MSSVNEPFHGTRPLGSTLIRENQTQFTVWAPNCQSVNVEIIDRHGDVETVRDRYPMESDPNGFFSKTISDCGAGTLYRFQLNRGMGRPDPRSKSQPFGVHGPSAVVDSNQFQWTDQNWTGMEKKNLVIYELHLGSFTSSGTYLAAIEQLDALVKLGITAVEFLPLAQCPGNWNWGYDGVNYFAPSNNFGTPNELKCLVDACHNRGLAVINDVVYNHVGPEGNYLSEFAPYRSPKFNTPWGDALNFERDEVRQFVLDNVSYWIDEFHFDGLRLDAVHYMFDDREDHILSEIQDSFRKIESAQGRRIHLIGESNIFDADLIKPLANGDPNYDAIWSDCLMHSIYKHGNPAVRLTDRHYQENDIAEAVEHAYVFSTPEAMRVTESVRKKQNPLGDRSYIESLITALQTHDSVGNHPHGKRLHQLTSPQYQRSAAGLILLYPSIPMIFMGEEWSTEAPFPFFADFEDPRLRQLVDQGRRNEYPHHNWDGSPLPSDPTAFTCTKSQPDDLNPETNRWYQELLSLRKQLLVDDVLSARNLSTYSDLENSVFKLSYKTAEVAWHVCSRLAGLHATPLPLETLDAGEILFDSNYASSKPNEISGSQRLIWMSKK